MLVYLARWWYGVGPGSQDVGEGESLGGGGMVCREGVWSPLFDRVLFVMAAMFRHAGPAVIGVFI
jgi:hypothetical protein